MSSQQDTSHLWDDERITAYVLNELNDQERESFEAAIRLNPQLADAVEKARSVTTKLEGFFSAIPKEMLEDQRLQGLLDERRTSDLGSAHTNPQRKGRSPWLSLAAAAGIVFVLAAISVPIISSTLSRSSNVAMNRPDISQDISMSSEFQNDVEGSVAIEPLEISEMEADGLTASVLPKSTRARKEHAPVVGRSRPTRQQEKAPASMKALKRTPKAAEELPLNAAADSASMELQDIAQVETASPPVPLPGRLARADKPVDEGMELQMGRTMDNRGRATRQQQNAKSKSAIDQGMGMKPGLPGLPGLRGISPELPGDRYETIVENTFKRVTEHPLSTLSIDVDTASYSKVRMSLQRNQMPSPDAVRIEEMINYFDYEYEKVSDTINADTGTPDPFSASLDVAECPWEPEHRLVRVGLQAIELDKQERPRCNLVFLIDTSGSMRATNKLPLLIDGMKLLVKELRPDDQVAIVVYAGSAGLVLESTPAEESKKIINALSRLQAGGSTNGGAGLSLAYETARKNFVKDGVNRVILCSDGDFNVGMTGTGELVREAKSQAKSGVELTVLGFGMGNHNDAMMEQISNDAEGNYAFVDTIAEAKKVLADQLTGTLVTVAKDVKIQIEFNPVKVSSYRLIGYENRLLAKEDFNDDTKDAGEIGAGHRVTALYQVVPVGAEPDPAAPRVDPLKYQSTEATQDEPVVEPTKPVSDEMLTLKLRYKPPQGDKSVLMTRTLTDEGGDFREADNDFQFAAALAGFGMLLRNSPMAGSWSYDDVIEVAADALGTDEHGLREEMIELAAIANRLSQ